MKETILKMKKSLEDDCYIAFVSANEDYHFGVRKNDEVRFLDEKTIAITRKSGRTTIINLNLIIGICIRRELI